MKMFKWHMLITSLLPLWVSIIVFNCFQIGGAFKNNWNVNKKNIENILCLINKNIVPIIFSLIIVLLVTSSIIYINIILKRINKTSDNNVILKIDKVQQERKLSSEYLLAYILPLFVFNFSAFQDILLFLIYFFTFSFLSLKNGNVYVNIYLETKGYKLYRADLEKIIIDKKEIIEDCLIISNDKLYKHSEVSMYDLEKDVFIKSKGEKE